MLNDFSQDKAIENHYTKIKEINIQKSKIANRNVKSNFINLLSYSRYKNNSIEKRQVERKKSQINII